jgi:hypothetical protein
LLRRLLIGGPPPLIDFKQLLPHKGRVSPNKDFFVLGVALILAVLHVVLLHVLVHRNFIQSVAIARGEYVPVKWVLIFLSGVIVASILSVVLTAFLNLMETREPEPALGSRAR